MIIVHHSALFTMRLDLMPVKVCSHDHTNRVAVVCTQYTTTAQVYMNTVQVASTANGFVNSICMLIVHDCHGE